MNIALMSHDRKKELMVQFCIAYCGILSKHTICATNTTGRLVSEATGLPVQLFLSHEHGGSQQIGARIAYNEIDMVLFFNDPQSGDLDADLKYITNLCDQYNVRRMVPKSRSRTMPWVTLFRAAMAAPAVTTGTQQIRKRALVTIMSNTRARNRISGFSRLNKLFTRRPPLCCPAPGTPRRRSPTFPWVRSPA